MPYCAIQWATGGVGRAAVQAIVSHPELTLVGCWVHDPAKVGRDVGTLCGLIPIGVEATNDEHAFLGLPADCVVYSPIVAKSAQVIRIPESGKNVVTALNQFYPGRRDDSAVEAACQREGVGLHGIGIHQEGVTERFPLMIAALARDRACARGRVLGHRKLRRAVRSGRVDAVRQDACGGGEDSDAGLPRLRFLQSVDRVADALGFVLDTSALS